MSVGFVAGYSTYQEVVKTSGEVLVGKDTYILKTELVGPILKTEAVKEIDHLIQFGQAINNNDEETRVWLMRVLAFIHGLNLKKDSLYNGQPMSAIESDIRWVFEGPIIKNPETEDLRHITGI